MAAIVVSLALLALGLGVVPLPLGLQLGGTGLLVGLGVWLCRPQRSRWDCWCCCPCCWPGAWATSPALNLAIQWP